MEMPENTPRCANAGVDRETQAVHTGTHEAEAWGNSKAEAPRSTLAPCLSVYTGLLAMIKRSQKACSRLF